MVAPCLSVPAWPRKERQERITDTITDPDRLVVRPWTGRESAYSQEKMMKQCQGIYVADGTVAMEVVIAEPFRTYVVDDAVALAGQAARLRELYRR